MHQAVRQLTISGEQQQAAGVVVEPPNGDPALAPKLWQLLKDSRPAFRIVAAADLAFRLVVEQVTMGSFPDADVFAVNLNAVLVGNPITQGSHFSVDADSSVADPALYLPARGETPGGQDFLEFL